MEKSKRNCFGHFHYFFFKYIAQWTLDTWQTSFARPCFCWHFTSIFILWNDSVALIHASVTGLTIDFHFYWPNDFRAWFELHYGLHNHIQAMNMRIICKSTDLLHTIHWINWTLNGWKFRAEIYMNPIFLEIVSQVEGACFFFGSF